MADSIIPTLTTVPVPSRDATLIIGGGIAGIFAALKLAPHPVTILTAAPFGEGASSAWAQGGMAAAVGEGDTAEKHLADTLIAGAGIVDEEIAGLMTSEARARIEDLLSYGVPFDRDIEGKLQTGREAAHSERRIVHVNGDTAGKAIMAALIKAVRQTPSIRVIENFVAERLTLSDGVVTGVVARGARGTAENAVHFPAHAIVLATGGVGHLYAVTTNPPEANGNGVALAARAGALLADLEFVQFHPTAVDIGRDPAPLATEALRGEGAVLINSAGERFMLALHPDAELAPRDVVARAIHAEIAAGRGAFLDCRDAIGARFATRFPTVYASCLAGGIDPATTPIPMAPAEHYHMGGVFTDAHGRTTLPGLWACGEVASTGVHGANRLASNSLLEAVVFATRVAADIARLDPPTPVEINQDNVASNLQPAGPADAETITAIRKIMADEVGVIRDAEGLARALTQLTQLERGVRSAMVQNMLLVARLITTAALNRQESRGGHYRRDFPETDPAQAHRSFMALASGPGANDGITGEESCPCMSAFLPVLPHLLVTDAVKAALLEDLGRAGDITSQATIPADTNATALFVARKAGVLAGIDFAREAMRLIDPEIRFEAFVKDGARLEPGTVIAEVSGPARGILSGERVALNFLGRLCGVATATARFADAIAHTKAHIVCTRKTTPGLRAFEKYAVRCGGGSNHRFGLDDAVLIKDNHIAVCGSVAESIRRAKAFAGHLVKIEVEVDTLEQLEEAMPEAPDVVLLDNMGPDMLRKAVAYIAGRALTEASGGVTPDTVVAIAEAGVDLISTGWITHSAPVLDIGLDIEVG